MAKAYRKLIEALLEDMTSTGSFKYAAATTLTIASGAITATQVVHTVEGEGAASDTLYTINGGAENQTLILYPETAGNLITLGHSSGNIVIAGDVDYEIPVNGFVILLYDGTNWRMMSAGTNEITLEEAWAYA